MDIEQLKKLDESLGKAIDLDRSDRKGEENNDFLTELVDDNVTFILEALHNQNEINKEAISVLNDTLIKQNESFDKSIKAVSEAIKAVKINSPDVVVPEIKIPEVKLPQINVPEAKVNISTDGIEKTLTKAFKGIKPPVVNVPESIVNVEVPKMDFQWPEGDMSVKGVMELAGVDTANPLPVQLRDAQGKPVDFGVNSSSGGRAGYKSVQIENSDGNIISPITSLGADWFTQVAMGNVPKHSFVHKFGRNETVGTSLVPVADGGVYPTPQTGSTVTLAAISNSVNDTAAGSGAREITLQYLDSTGALQTDTIAMNGTTETTETITDVWRLFRFYVSKSGTYGTATTPSSTGTITIRVAGAGATWGVLGLADTAFGTCQSLVAAYTVPLGYTAYILQSEVSVDTGKSVDVMFFARQNADATSAPYSAMRVQNYYEGITSTLSFNHRTSESYPALTDIGFMAKTSTGTAGVSCEFELLLVQD